MSLSRAILSSASAPERFAILCTEHLAHSKHCLIPVVQMHHATWHNHTPMLGIPNARSALHVLAYTSTVAMIPVILRLRSQPSLFGVISA